MPHDQNVEPTPSDAFSSTVHSTATEPNQVGPGRTLGLLFDWLGEGLESFLNKRAAQLNLGPEATAADIRRIRRHEEMSILVRYAVPYANLTKDQEKKVHKLCKKLLKYVRSHVRSTQLRALEEIRTLAIEDRVVRIALLNCDVGRLVPNYKEPDLSKAITRTINCVENGEVHELWSPMIAFVETMNVGGGLCEDVESRLGSLKKSLSNTESSFLAARYLLRVVQHYPQQHNLLPGPGIISLCELWAHYLDFSTKFPDELEWSNINNCGSIMCLANDHIYQKDVGEFLIKNSRNLRTFFAAALDVTTIEVGSFDSLSDLAEPFNFLGPVLFQMAQLVGFRSLKNGFAIPNFRFSSFLYFLKALTGSEAYLFHLAFLRGQERKTQRKLRKIFIGNEVLVVFRRIAEHIIEADGMPCASCQCLSLGENSTFGHTLDCTIDCPMRAITVLSSYQASEDEEYRELATFLISVIFSTNRYYKLALCNASNNVLCFSQRTLRCASSLFPSNYRRFLDRAVWRVRVKGKYRIVRGALRGTVKTPASPACKDLPDCHGDIDRIDVTLLRNDLIMMLPVNEKIPLNATGHFPIIAFTDGSHAPSYLAIVTKDDGTETFATVKDGDSYATYYDQCGDLYGSHNFVVLVLRHDPVDFLRKMLDENFMDNEEKCFIPRAGALDTTGPVYWLQYSPRRDTEFFEEVAEYLPQSPNATLTQRAVQVPATKDILLDDFEVALEGGSNEVKDKSSEDYRSGESAL